MKNDVIQLDHWIELPQFVESRGILTAIDFGDLPFSPSRIFFITDVPPGTTRGGHAHKIGDQILICVSGRIEVDLRTKNKHQKVICEPNGLGLFLRAGVWAQQIYLGTNSRLFVLCSHPYGSDSYINEIGRPLS